MRLVFVTQLIDPTDPDLGFVPGIIGALRDQVDELTVIANEVRAVPAGLDGVVRTLGKEHGRGTVGRGLRFQRELASVVRRQRPDALIAHMCPIYLSLAAPMARVTRTASLLWYVNAAESRSLSMAERLADRILTAMPDSYPRAIPKLRVTGHSIDTDTFAWQAPSDDGGVRLLSLGRTTPTKRHDLAIRAVGQAVAGGTDVRLRIVGPSMTAAERAYRDELEWLVHALSLEEHVAIQGGVAPAEVPALIGWSTGVVNASDNADKVVYETMSCGRMPLYVNRTFDDLCDGAPTLTRFDPGDVASLSERIAAVGALGPDQQASWGRELRRRIVARHSLEHWAEEVVAVAAEASHRTRASRRRATLTANSR